MDPMHTERKAPIPLSAPGVLKGPDFAKWQKVLASISEDLTPAVHLAVILLASCIQILS